MDSGISLIKALAITLVFEIDSLSEDDRTLPESEAFNLNKSVREFEVKLIKAALLKTRGINAVLPRCSALIPCPFTTKSRLTE